MQLPGRFKGLKRGRMGRFNIVIAILLAGWVPSILMLGVSYTILTNTLESKILRDRQTFVQLTAHLVADDLANTSTMIEYYQTLPNFAKIFTVPNRETAAQQWLSDAYFSHPRIDGMFLTDGEGRLIAAVPSTPEMIGQGCASELWREESRSAAGVEFSPLHPGQPARRIATVPGEAGRHPTGRGVA